MDLEWLLPEQLEQILKLCELSSVDDLAIAANILEHNHWNLENAMHDVVTQNDAIKKQEDRQLMKEQTIQHTVVQSPTYQFHQEDEDAFELDPEQYQQLDFGTLPTVNIPYPENSHTNILAEQNRQYAEIEQNYHRKKTEEEEYFQAMTTKEKEYEQGRAQFQTTQGDFLVKFRLAHKTAQFGFNSSDKIARVFKYVSCCQRDGFQHTYADFDLAQAFPALSLKGKEEQTLQDVFGESGGEVLIVREI